MRDPGTKKTYIPASWEYIQQQKVARQADHMLRLDKSEEVEKSKPFSGKVEEYGIVQLLAEINNRWVEIGLGYMSNTLNCGCFSVPKNQGYL